MQFNGRTVMLEKNMTLLEFLKAERLDSKLIAVERNGVIVPKAEYETTWLSDEDRLEVVTFVGGG